MTDPFRLSVREARRLLDEGELSSKELTRATLERIHGTDEVLGAFLTVCEDLALRQAEESDSRRGRPLSPLDGIPVGVKDVICTRGVRTTAASRMLESFVPPYDATVVERLRRAGAVLVGKLNCDEFAMGSSTENSAFRRTRNPWDRERVPGGSSGGSAAAVAARQCPLALGTDTGGSIRQPAALCGVVGLKPTYGRVSRYGVVAYASSLEQVGPIAREVWDCAAALGVLAGHDPADATSVPREVPDYLGVLERPLGRPRVGLPSEYFGDGIDPVVRDRVLSAVEVLRELGAEVGETSLPHTPYAVACYYLVATAEASSNLARYDGIRYGFRAPDAKDLLDLYCRTRRLGFGPEVKRRIMLGTYALSAGYYEAYYLRAQKVRTLIRRDFETAFSRYDVLATPTSPTSAFPLGSRLHDPLQMYLSDVLTIAVNLAGLPAISLPCGFDDSGLPVGLQLVGRPFEEETILRLGHAYQSATSWHRAEPPLDQRGSTGG
ncbi:MAG: glutamyl-tRNA(Gln) amidotransferase subunit A [Candidatus Binatia bacterium]|nr:MAG: glutamyl-tRNA(Gln) amidotransferase subunit A [Candidatus Binatia bacterium]